MLLAYWYRRQLTQTLMVWKKPEMVIVTIIFSVAALILFIVGISGFFVYGDFLNSNEIDKLDKEKFLNIGIICVLLLISLIFTYVAIRLLLVRVVTERGIVVNDRILRIPDFRNVVEWNEVADYYLVSDYPNVIFTLIVRRQGLQFERYSMRVPVFVRDDFEDLLETQMYSATAMRSRSDIGSHKFSEN
ncbi:MAG: hypothetical protein SF052_12950 [Bacteroidia bacterium]|nr:hypothetical protein [Bacteroidia bacterium]